MSCWKSRLVEVKKQNLQMCLRKDIFSQKYLTEPEMKKADTTGPPAPTGCWATFIHRSHIFLHALQAESLTAFVPNYLFKNTYIVNSLEKQM